MNFFRRLFLFLPLAGFVGQLMAATHDPVPRTYNHVENGGVSSYTLANGFKVILAPYSSSGKTKVSLVVRVGSKMEGYGESGMAHLLEHMIYMGAGQRKSVKDELTKLNAAWNGTTSADRTNYFATIQADQRKLEELIRIKADMFLEPRFTEDDLRREMTVVRNEMEINENNPDFLVDQALNRQAFYWHGYGRAVIGARSDVENVPYPYLKDFHRKYYRPDNAFLLIAGVFDYESTKLLVNQLFGRATNPAISLRGDWTREPSRPLNSISEIALPAGIVKAVSAWKLPPAVNRETTAFQLASSALCSPQWGVLRRVLVTDKKLATAASCGTQPMRDATLFVAVASGGKADDPEAMRVAMVDVLQNAAVKGISSEELERSRIEYLNGYERTTRSMDAFAGELESNEVLDDWRRFFLDWDILREITLEEANAALRKWMSALGRSDVILRHRDRIELPQIPEMEKAASLVGSKRWSPVTKDVSAKPNSWAEFKSAVQFVDFDKQAKGALIQRKTSGDRIWLQLQNRYGNLEYMRKNALACGAASALFAFGGGDLDQDALDRRMEALDAQWSLGLGGLSLSVSKSNLVPALDTLIKVWLDPHLPKAEFQRLKDQGIAGIDAMLTDPVAIARQHLAFRFDNFPIGHPGKPKAFETIRQEWAALEHKEIVACAREIRRLADHLLIVTGDLSREEVLNLWRERFKPLPRPSIPYERIAAPSAPSSIATEDIVVTLPNKPNATILAQGVLPLAHGASDLPALRLAFLALGGMNSRLYKRLREVEGLSYSVEALFHPNPRDPRSTWSIAASVASAAYPRALDILREEIAKLSRDGFAEAELVQAKAAWRERRQRAFVAESGYTGFVASLLEDDISFEFLMDYDQAIANLSLDEVNKAFRQYVSPEKTIWAVGAGSP